MQTITRALTPRTIQHADRQSGQVRDHQAFQVGDDPHEFLVQRSGLDGWKLVDRIDEPVSPCLMNIKYGVWKDQPGLVGPAPSLTTSLLRAMGAYPAQRMTPPDQKIQSHEVKPFQAPHTMALVGSFVGHWSSSRIDVTPGQHPTLSETSESICLLPPF